MEKFLDVMEHELEVSARIISDLLDFARERPPVLRPCPLPTLVEEAVARVPNRPQVKVINEVPASLPIPRLDKEQFRQALINLIQNAVEAIPAERTGEVHIRAEGGEQAPLRISVSDDGVGIPAEVIPKIFLPLFTTKSRGTGLGLAIVAGMVQRHGGTISVSSDGRQGATFNVELPSQVNA
jgi:signal transduction histidine kinase